MISFEPSEEESELQRSTHRFSDEHTRPLARACEESGVLPDGLTRRFWDLGVAQMGYPQRCGGLEVGLRAAVLVEEELAWGDPGICAALPRPGLAGSIIAALGAEAQDRWLAPLLADRDRFAGAALFDAVPDDERVLAATATRTEGGLVLNGTKSDSIAADRAEWIVTAVLAGDEPLLFAVPAGAVRFTVDHHRLGLRAVPYGTVQLDGCAVSADQIMARGAPAARAVAAALERDVLLWSARAVGTARAAFEYAVRYATERHTFGKPIAEHQGVAFMLADMGIAVDAARYLVWYAAWAIDSGLPELLEYVYAASAFAAEAAVRVSTDAVQVLGGHGYIQDHPVEMWMRDARTIANLAAQSVALLRRVAVNA